MNSAAVLQVLPTAGQFSGHVHTEIMTDTQLKRLLQSLAAGAAGASIYHGAAFALHRSDQSVNLGRHLVFVIIDATLCILLVTRPRWLVLPALAVAIQAVWSHGHHAWLAWHVQQSADWLSFAVLLYCPVLVLAALANARRNSPSSFR